MRIEGSIAFEQTVNIHRLLGLDCLEHIREKRLGMVKRYAVALKEFTGAHQPEKYICSRIQPTLRIPPAIGVFETTVGKDFLYRFLLNRVVGISRVYFRFVNAFQG